MAAAPEHTHKISVSSNRNVDRKERKALDKKQEI
ncbi:hypothetical protein COLO4_32757 [Corchorus olitorius]|uniref:Uncharacterized protein n=1 Tax=Corchorus olitorius TaxID=93759 RepID=A0A1R3GY48_9ROSI|nr:hypothetical protein COLO4_32757 [Corchorus olitorius]